MRKTSQITTENGDITMKLWLLKKRSDLPADDDPWNPPHDKNHGLVVRAETEEIARQIAQVNAVDEKHIKKMRPGFPGEMFVARTFAAWTDGKYSTCVELSVDGEESVIIVDNLAS